MKSSRYNVQTESPETGEFILFNTLYGGTLAIDSASIKQVESLLSDPSSAHSNEQLDKLETLKRGKFIIDSHVDELEILRNRKNCGIADRNRADVIIMPNMDCNFACPYCYETHDHKNRMSTDVEESIKRWLGKIIESHKVVLLNWFGGEPLLSYKTILNIGSFAQHECEIHGTSLLCNITTNGYALNEKLIDKLTGIGILSYQITVDGPADIHNKTRILKTGRETFERIRENIVVLAESDARVKISLRVNFNQKNIHHIPELLDQFPNSIRRQLRIVFEPVFGNDELSATKNLSAEEISSSINEYYDLANEKGYDVIFGGLGVGKFVYCYAEREHQYIVNYNGDVFKCSVSDFSASNRLGHIDSNGNLEIERSKWADWFGLPLFDMKCEECTFLPLCMGGCRKDRLENKATGSYCSLVPTNTSHALKSIAFDSFNELLGQEVNRTRNCRTEQKLHLS